MIGNKPGVFQRAPGFFLDTPWRQQHRFELNDVLF
jgi:hypothetical protein